MPQILSDEEFSSQFGGGFRAAPKPVGMAGRFGAAMDRTEGSLYGLGEAVGLPLGELRRENQAESDATMQRYYRETGAPQRFSDVHTGGDLASYGLGLAVDSAPVMAGIAAGGLVGGPAGAFAAGSAFGAGDVLDNQREQGGDTNLATALPLGMAYGAADSMLGVGGMLARRTTGSGIRALDRAGMDLLDGAKGAKGVAARTGATALKTGGVEATTETFQEGMNQLGRMSVDPSEDFYNERSAENFKESAIGGGLLGGVLGGAAGGWRRSESYRENEKRELLASQDEQQSRQVGMQEQRDMRAPVDEALAGFFPEAESDADAKRRRAEYAKQFGEAAGAPSGEFVSSPEDGTESQLDMGQMLSQQVPVSPAEQAAIDASNASLKYEQELQQHAASLGVPPKTTPGLKAVRMLEDVKSELSPEEYGAIEGIIRGGQYGAAIETLNNREKTLANAAKEQQRAAEKAQKEANRATEKAQKEANRATEKAQKEATRAAEKQAKEAERAAKAATPTAAEIAVEEDTPAPVVKESFTTAPKTLPNGQVVRQVAPAVPVAPAAPKADFRTQYRAANTQIAALRAERKKLVVVKDASGKEVKGSEAAVGDLGDVDATSPTGKRVAQIDNEINAALPPVADIRAHVETLLANRDQLANGKSRAKDPVLQRRLSAVTGIVMGDQGLEQPATPISMAEVARREGVSKQSISQQLQNHGLSDLHIARLVANDLAANTDTTADVADENDAPSDSGSDQYIVSDKSIDDTSVSTHSSAAKAMGNNLVGVGGVEPTREQKNAEVEATKTLKAAPEVEATAPTESDLAFEAKRKEAARERTLQIMAQWAKSQDGVNAAKDWDFHRNAGSPRFAELTPEQQVHWLETLFTTDEDKRNDPDYIHGLQRAHAEQNATDVPAAGAPGSQTVDAGVTGNGERDTGPSPSGRDAPAPVVTKARPKVVRDANGRRINADVIGPDQATANQVNKEVLDGKADLPVNADVVQSSKAPKSEGSNAAIVTAELQKFMRLGALGNKVTVVQTVADLPAGIQRSVNPTADTQGFVVNGKAYLVAGNIAPGKARSVFLHEVGAHLGLENLLGNDNYAALVAKVNQWATKNDGSQESKLAQAAQQRVTDAGTEASQTDSELVAYFIEEAVDAGIDPTATQANSEFGRWFRTLWAAFKKAMHTLGVNPDKLTAQNVVDMAYGAAHVALKEPAEPGASATDTPESVLRFYRQTERGKELRDGAGIDGNVTSYTGPGTERATWGTGSKVGGFGPIRSIAAYAQQPAVPGVVRSDGGGTNATEAGSLGVYFFSPESEAVAKQHGEKSSFYFLQASVYRDTPNGPWSVILNTPPVDGKVFATLKAQGLVEEATDPKTGEPTGYGRVTGVTDEQRNEILAEARRRLTRVMGGEVPALKWVRTTGRHIGAHSEMSAERVKAKFSKSPAMRASAEAAQRVMGRSGSLLMDNAIHGVTKLARSMMSLHDVVQEYKGKLPAVNDWYKSMLATQATRTKLEASAEAIMTQANKLKSVDAVNKFVADSTFEQLWGYGPKAIAGSEMVQRFNRLQPAEQSLVKAMFAHGDEMLAAKYAILKKLGLKTDLFTGTGKLGGPYAPLKRFGNFIAILRSQEMNDAREAGDRKRVEALKSDPQHYLVSSFTSIGLANQFADDNKAAFPHTETFEKSVRVAEGRRMNQEVLQKVLSAVGANKDIGGPEKAALEKLISDMYFEAIDEQHARTSGLKRKNRGGYDANMLASLMSHARAEAGFLANLEHGGETNGAFYNMQAQARARGADPKLQDAFNTLAEHYKKSLNFEETPIQDRIMGVTSVMQLATSVGYHLNNAMQPIMSTLPKLAADFNNYGGAWKELLKGYGVLKDAGMMGNFTLSKVKDAGLRAALQSAYDAKLLDVGIEEDLSHLTRTRSGIASVDAISSVAASAVHKLRQVSRTVETANRVASAVAAYNLSMAQHGNQARAQDYVTSILSTTQGDVSRLNKPLLLKQLPKFMGQYKGFQFMMAGLYVKAFRQAVWGSPTERAIGLRMLAYKLSHTAVGAGMLGLPMMNLVAMVVPALFGKDGEPPDFERTLRETGIPEWMLHGPLGMIGLDMSAKMGEDKIFSILPYGTWDVTSGAGLAKTAIGLAGPAVSQAMKTADGVGIIKSGEYWKGIEKTMPKGVADGMKAFRTANEGYSLRNGDVMFKPEDISGLMLAFDALGLPSAEMKRMDWLRGQQYEITQFYKEQTRNLTHEYIQAAKDGDTEATAKLREDWAVLQAGKNDMRKYFGDSHDELKNQPLSTLLKAPHAAQLREQKLQRASRQ